MKKLLIISQHFPPEIGAASNRLEQLVGGFMNKGTDIFVITTKPNYPNPSLYTKEMELNHDQQVNYHLYRTPVLKGPFPEKIIRLINQFLFLFFATLFATVVSLKHSISVCLTTSPPFLVNFVGLYCKVILRRKWIMEVRDLWPDSLVAVGAVDETNKIFQWLKKLELSFYQKCNRIVVVTNRTKAILENQGIATNKVSIITNGIPNWISQVNQDKRVAQTTFNVCYIGNVGLSQNLNIVVDVAEQLQTNEQIHFYIVGEGLAKNALVSAANTKGLKNMTFVKGITNKQELMNWYQTADLGIVSLNKSSLFENVIPSKIFEYAACRTTMLFLGSGEAAEMIQENALGFSIESDAKQAAEVIQDMCDQTSNLHLDESKRQAFLINYSWDQLIDKYMKVITFDEKLEEEA